MRILPPRSVKPHANLFVGLYGPGGSGKTLLALNMAHRLTAPVGGEIVFIESDEGRAEYYSEFGFRPIPYRGYFSALDLVKDIDAVTEIAREEPGSITLIVDSLTPFHSEAGGLNDRNNNHYAQEFKGNTWSAWSKTGPLEEAPMYAAMRRFTKYGHLILCLEEAPDYNGKDLVGVKPKFRDGFGHRVDTLIRVERFFEQGATKRQEHPDASTAARDVHRAIIEKVSIAWNKPRPDGTVESQYPIDTGTVIPNPDGEIAARLLEYINHGAGDYDSSIDEYLKSLAGADREELLKAHGYAKRVAWPDEHRQRLLDAIVDLGKQQTPSAAEEPQTLQPVAAWAELTANHPVEAWVAAAEQLSEYCEDPDELQTFGGHAGACGRWADVKGLIEVRISEVDHLKAGAASGS